MSSGPGVGASAANVAAAAMHQTKAAVLDGTRPTLIGGAAVLDNRHKKKSQSNLAQYGPSGLGMSRPRDGVDGEQSGEQVDGGKSDEGVHRGKGVNANEVD